MTGVCVTCSSGVRSSRTECGRGGVGRTVAASGADASRARVATATDGVCHVHARGAVVTRVTRAVWASAARHRAIHSTCTAQTGIWYL